MQVKGFNTFKKADAHQLVNFLIKEHPQTIALILSHLNPEKVADVLSEFPEDLMSDVALRIATLGKIAPELLKEMESVVDIPEQQELEAEEIKEYKSIAKIYERVKPAQAAQVLSGLTDEEKANILIVMKDRQAAKIIAQMDPVMGSKISQLILNLKSK